jgi:surface protein
MKIKIDGKNPLFRLLTLAGILAAINVFVSFTASAAPTDDFVTKWKTDIAGNSNSTSIEIAVVDPGFNFDVDWNNDGVFDQTGLTSTVSHNYGVAGTYIVRIRGTFPHFKPGGDKNKLLEVVQWGTNQWDTMKYAFMSCGNLHITATDSPNLSQVTSLQGMFVGTRVNEPLNSWDVSHITDMSSMFFSAQSFNQSLSSWDVSHVTNFSQMFYGATNFNQNLSSWNTSSATNMSQMFGSALKFNGNVSTWDTSNVTDMSWMFIQAQMFNKDLSGWNVSKVTNMSCTFCFTNAFTSDLSNWDTSNVTDMNGTFWLAFVFTSDLSGWNVSKVTNMNNMFNGAVAFNSELSAWNVNKVTNMHSMFENAWAFNKDISSWDVSSVTDMGSMFNTASAFNQDLSPWNVSNVTTMATMFEGSKLDSTHYDALLEAWSLLPLRTAVPLGATGMSYCYGQLARQTMIDNYAWTITGDANNCTNAAPRDLTFADGSTSLSFDVNVIQGAAATLKAEDWTPSETLTYALTCSAAGADDTRFAVVGDSLQAVAPLVFTAGGDNQYDICVRAADSAGHFVERSLSIMLLGAPTSPATPVPSSTNTPSRLEQTTVATADLTDATGGVPLVDATDDQTYIPAQLGPTPQKATASTSSTPDSPTVRVLKVAAIGVGGAVGTGGLIILFSRLRKRQI